MNYEEILNQIASVEADKKVLEAKEQKLRTLLKDSLNDSNNYSDKVVLKEYYTQIYKNNNNSNVLNSPLLYGINESGKIIHYLTDVGYEDSPDPYSNYLSENYAKMAQASKIFYDRTLAFKWCYDRDFRPDWFNDQEKRYYVSLDHFMGIFVIREAYSMENPGTVYFSSEEIAKMCANWLNDTYHLVLK